MNKFSIIIPTMWRYPRFVNFVHQLAEQDYCGEIVIINNDNTLTPAIHNSKIRLLDYGKNIGVNPAWNLGVYASKYENICIMNDDIEFDFAVFERVDAVLRKGILIINSMWAHEDKTNPGTIDIKPYLPTDQPYHFGSLMFITKRDWVHIPNELVIFYGDDWIWRQMKTRYDNNYVIWNLNMFTPGSVTCNLLQNKQEILDQEIKIYGEKLKTLDLLLTST